MAREIGVADVLQAMEEVVKIHGESYIYRRPVGVDFCVYVDNGSASCLIAKVLYLLGVPLDRLAKCERKDIGAAYRTGWLGVHISEDALEVMTSAQWVQDHGSTWGQALNKAKQRAGMLAG